MRARNIEWCDSPTMNPRNTNQLRKFIERRQTAYLWGQPQSITPRLCGRVFGDGRQLIVVSPIMFRPNYFVVRIDSSWSTSNWDRDNPMTPSEWIDDILDAISEEFVEWPWAKEYGLRWSDDERDDCQSEIDWSDGLEWGEMQWPQATTGVSPITDLCCTDLTKGDVSWT